MSKRIERAEREGSRDNEADRGRGRGAFLQYYDDLGFSSTPAAHAQWKEEETNYQNMRSKELSSIAEYESQINKYREQVEAAKKSIPSVRSATEKAWAKHKSQDLKPVTPVSKWKSEWTGEWKLRQATGDGTDEMEKVYKRVPIPMETLYLHPDQIHSLSQDKDMKKVLKPQEMEEYPELGTLVNTSYRSRMFQPGRAKGTQKDILHALNTAQEEYYNKYITAVGAKNREEIGKANSLIAGKEGELAGAMASVEAAKNKIATIDSFRKQQMDNLRKDYNDKINTMREIFGG